jgi:hypothetical protein
MTWSRIDDAFTWHPKVLAAGNAAVGCWVRCLAHCSGNKSDGFVAMPVARAIGSPADLRALTDAGLWRAVRAGEIVSVTGRRDSGRRSLPDVQVHIPGDGYWIADYLHFHRSHSEIASGGRNGDDGESAPERRTTRTSECADARASVHQTRAPTRSNGADTARAISQPPPTQPSTQTPNPLPLPTSSAQMRAAPDGADASHGASEGGGPASPADGTDPAWAITERLVSLGWRSRSNRFARQRLVRTMVAEQDLTLEAVDRLWVLASERGGDPVALLATWLDRAAWKDVLAEQAMKNKQAVQRRAPTSDDIGPIYGDPKPISDLIGGALP